jgi:anaerobic ribonucleoside-triphosphate reductase activating protein
MRTIEVAYAVPGTAAEGPHLRFALWLQGCALRCPGCCNPELFERGRGHTHDVAALAREVVAAACELGLDGITVLGGEPLEQADALAELLGPVRAAGLGVIVFTGYDFEEAADVDGFDRLWPMIDTLVDGRFDARRPELHRRFIGSTNQRLVHRTDRYRDPALWIGERIAELHVDQDGTLRMLGTPSLVRAGVRALQRAAP